jgi:antitoxin YefM
MAKFSIRALEQDLGAKLNQVESTQKGTVITLGKGKKDLVIITKDEYNGLLETLHLLSTKANREALRQSRDEAEKGDVIAFSSGEEFLAYANRANPES